MSSIEEQAARQDLDSISHLSFGPAAAKQGGLYSGVPTLSFQADAAEPTATLVSQDARNQHNKDRKDSLESNFTSVSQRKNRSAYYSSRRSPSGVSNRIALDLLALAKDAYQQQQENNNDNHESSKFLSQIEANILRSSEPIDINEHDEIEVFGERGIWANKSESLNWRGPIPISQYVLNNDSQPEIVTKRSKQKIEYTQEFAVRYLRPPTPPQPGEIVIRQEANLLIEPAPPLVIRQQPARPITPEPLIIREAPPPAPQPVGRKIITISGKLLPPPPRKVVIERFAQLPAKPQSVLIERWLPYKQLKRRVIFQAAPPDPIVAKPRNVIIQWVAPEVEIRKEFKYLGIVKANPVEYVKTYGASLHASNDLPSFVRDIKQPDGVVLAADHHVSPNMLHELEGDLEALKLVNLDEEGLSAYKSYLTRIGILAAEETTSSSKYSKSYTSESINTNAESNVNNDALTELITQIFHTIDRHNQGRITIEDAEKTLLRLNSRLGRNYGENDVGAFFGALDVNNDGTLDLEEFKRAFLSITA